MNAYTTMGQARIQHRDISTIIRTQSFMAGAALAAFERQRGWQAEAELDWLLKQDGAKLNPALSRISTLRKILGTALVGVGERVAGAPESAIAPRSILASVKGGA